MTSTPDGISFSDLQNMMEKAPKERDIKAAPTWDGKTREEIEAIAEKVCEAALEECNDPMVHREMLNILLINMLRWHTTTGLTMMEKEETEMGMCWLRDAGKFQACMEILAGINFGHDDWLNTNG